MPNYININSLENLPAEQTLLINYTISHSGTWYLSQLLTAYRNVCDSGWTIMYPNHQHPRHSDFPIIVGANGGTATFAWNYGGIQGILPENFDNYHSYLVQLSIFEYYCVNTGESPSTGSNTGGSTGTSTGSTGSGGSGGSTGVGGGGGGGGGGGPGGPHPELPKIPTEPPIQDPVHGSGKVIAYPSEWVIPDPVSPNLSIPTIRPEIPNIPWSVNSTISFPEGEPANPNSAIITPQSLSQYLDLQVVSTEVYQGTSVVASTVFSCPVDIDCRIIITIQDSTTSLVVGSTGYITCASGDPLPCGGNVNTGSLVVGGAILIARVYDRNNNILALKSILINILPSFTNTGTGGSEPVGGITLPVALVNENTNGISSAGITIDLPSNSSKLVILEATSPQTTFSALLKTKHGNQDSYSLTVFAPTTETVTSSPNVAISRLVTQISIPSILSSEISDNTLLTAPIIRSDSKYKINGVESYPDSHTVGIATTTIPSTTLLVVKVSPSINNQPGSTIGSIYTSSNFRKRSVAVSSISSTSVTAYVDLAKSVYGLVINGKQPQYVPETYSVKLSTSNMIGAITWSNLSLEKGDYFSIIESSNGYVNPFKPPVFIGQYV